MKNNEKKGLIILAVVAIVIIGVIFLITRPKTESNTNTNAGSITEENKTVEEFVQNLDDGTKINTSTKLNETKTVNGLKIGNIQLTNKNNQSILLADVENTSGKDTPVMLIDIILIDKNGNELGKVNGIIGDLKAGAKTQLNTSTMIDYANAYDFKIVVK